VAKRKVKGKGKKPTLD